jgi:putative transposase
LNRNFEVNLPNRCWAGDITFIKSKEGWLYLAIVMDICSRKIVGWSMSNRINTELVNQAFLMAIWQRKPAKGLLWHTDQGSQYASHNHRELLNQHHVVQSMSRKGDCWDNAVSESFFGTLKRELIHNCNLKSMEEAKKIIFEYIEVFYNQIRIHSTNNYLSPNEYEELQNVA